MAQKTLMGKLAQPRTGCRVCRMRLAPYPTYIASTAPRRADKRQRIRVNADMARGQSCPIFEWDGRKSESNFRKHGIRFEEAALAFNDPFAVSDQDRIESGEQRWQTIGMSGGCLLLLVAHTVRFEEQGFEVVRIISARRVNRKERRRYEHG